MNKKILLPLGITAMAVTLNGANIAYEGFGGYTADVSLETQTAGGSGWAGDWTAINPNATVDDRDRFHAQAAGLSNGAYAGTDLISTPGSTFYQHEFGINAHNVYQRVMSNSFTGNTGGTIYFSYLVQGTAFDANVARFSIQDTSASGRTIEIENNGTNLQIVTSGNPGGGGGNPKVTNISTGNEFSATGGTYFVVGKVNWTSGVDSTLGTGTLPYNTFNGVDTVDVIVFSDTDTVGLTEPGAGGWDLSAEAYWNDDINFNSIEIISSLVDQYAFDEIRVGTTWESVAVPEPSTYALMFGFLALGFTMWHRKRNQ